MPWSHVEAARGGTQQSTAFEVLVQLSASLRGCGELNDELQRLQELCGAERAMIARVDGARHRLIAVSDRNAGQLFSERRPPCFAVDMLDAVNLMLMPGKVLLLSSLIREGDAQSLSAMLEARERARLLEVAVIILETRDGCCDVIEIQLGSASASVEALLASMGPALSRCWTSRLPGTARASAECTRLRPAATEKPVAADLLSANNPAGLSRSEFRICALMREGMPTKRIARDLAIQPTTLRAHLHSIYAKTGAAGQFELIHRLTREERSSRQHPKPSGVGHSDQQPPHQRLVAHGSPVNGRPFAPPYNRNSGQ